MTSTGTLSIQNHLRYIKGEIIMALTSVRVLGQLQALEQALKWEKVSFLSMGFVSPSKSCFYPSPNTFQLRPFPNCLTVNFFSLTKHNLRDETRGYFTSKVQGIQTILSNPSICPEFCSFLCSPNVAVVS